MLNVLCYYDVVLHHVAPWVATAQSRQRLFYGAQRPRQRDGVSAQEVLFSGELGRKSVNNHSGLASAPVAGQFPSQRHPYHNRR